MKPSISKATCPIDSQVYHFLNTIDFEDSFAFHTPKNSESIEDIYIKIFSTSPKWILYAMRIRNLLVSPFGLKSEIKKTQSPDLKVGEKAGIFMIYKITDNEIIAGDDDKHLNFRVSLHRNNDEISTITISTLVQYNNFFGKMYMTMISPIHKLVVKGLLKSSLERF